MTIIEDSDLATFLNIGDSIDATTLQWAADAANRAVCEYAGRTFDKTATEDASARLFRTRDQIRAVVDDFWETSELIVETDDGDTGNFATTWTLDDDFILEPLNGLMGGQPHSFTTIVALRRSFPIWNRRPGLRVTAAWGWEDTPDPVFEATLIKGARLFKRKDSADGIAGFNDVGVIRVSAREDPDVVGLLGPFRHPRIAVMIG